MKIFLAGIMQGSHLAAVLHDQDYRSALKRQFAQHWPGAEVYDPLADHGLSLEYTDEEGKQVFLRHNEMAGETDLLVAFVPQASMGTAIEMWEAYRLRKAIVSISPMPLNWVIRFLSDAVYPDLESFESALSSGEIASIVAQAKRRQVE